MAPLPKIRRSYASDAAYMARLQGSVGRDPDLTKEERLGVARGLADITSRLMSIDARRASEAVEDPEY